MGKSLRKRSYIKNLVKMTWSVNQRLVALPLWQCTCSQMRQIVYEKVFCIKINFQVGIYPFIKSNPCDLLLFPNIKKTLKWIHLDDTDDIDSNTIATLMMVISQNPVQICFPEWTKWHLCKRICKVWQLSKGINWKGDLAEGMEEFYHKFVNFTVKF